MRIPPWTDVGSTASVCVLMDDARAKSSQISDATIHALLIKKICKHIPNKRTTFIDSCNSVRSAGIFQFHTHSRLICLKSPQSTETAMGITKKERIAVWDFYIGADKRSGKCFSCPTIIKMEDFHVGHVVAKAKGGSNDSSNLRPVCALCNKSMGTRNMNEFKQSLAKIPTVPEGVDPKDYDSWKLWKQNTTGLLAQTLFQHLHAKYHRTHIINENEFRKL
jgi:5-methylcytosine-specific restriction endonuclease McrA